MRQRSVTGGRFTFHLQAIGVQAPAGFWDPLGLSTNQPEGVCRLHLCLLVKLVLQALNAAVLSSASMVRPPRPLKLFSTTSLLPAR